MNEPVWDKIYQSYQKGGPAWATIESGLEPHFIDFINKTKFSKKSVFDIGYGTGQYMQFLKLKGFSVSGIDSSETAKKMADKVLGGRANLILGNMFEYGVAPATYDLIYSISTIHHGTKPQVSKILSTIHSSLLGEGYAYITLPIYDSTNEWMTFKDKEEVAPGTFKPGSGPEKGLPHSFFTKNEVEKLFSKYEALKVNRIQGRWHIVGQK